MSGRGAWPRSGAGGTLQSAGVPGPYYMIGVGSWGTDARDINHRATAYAVIAIQRRVKHLMNVPSLAVDGSYGPDTADAVSDFQRRHTDEGLTVWGGVGLDTARFLFRNRLARVCDHDAIVCGFVTNESAWDPGAVGFVDDQDLGLSQINGRAHPTYTEAERFNPTLAFEFTDQYLTAALRALDGRMIDAIVSYNLGVGGWSSTYDRTVGARGWIEDGRPDTWTPPGQTQPRDIKGYYTRIMTACKTV